MSASTAMVLEGLRELAADPEALAEVRPALRLLLGLDEQAGPVALQSLTDAGERLGVHRGTVQRWCIAGRMPGAMKVGSAWRVPVDSVPTTAGDDDQRDPRAPRRSGRAGRPSAVGKSSVEDALSAVITGRLRGAKTTATRSAPASAGTDRGRGPIEKDSMDMQNGTAKGGATVTPINGGTR